MEMNEYYKSPEWAEKRNARLKLDGFKCAKCGFTRALEVHHINYDRYGNEDVSRDLITLCKKCHQEIEEQKRKLNPVKRTEYHSVYLAGKIRCNGWREKIANIRDHSINQYETKPILVNASLTIMGPFFISCDHGCYHGDRTHGVGLNKYCKDVDGTLYHFGCCGNGEQPPFTECDVLDICKSQIDAAEIVFAYIDCTDCFGTLAEIGYAHAKGKTIIIKFASDQLKKDMWFIDKMQQITCNVSNEWINTQLLSKLKEE
jgi:hypothetical protein